MLQEGQGSLIDIEGVVVVRVEVPVVGTPFNTAPGLVVVTENVLVTVAGLDSLQPLAPLASVLTR